MIDKIYKLGLPILIIFKFLKFGYKFINNKYFSSEIKKFKLMYNSLAYLFNKIFTPDNIAEILKTKKTILLRLSDNLISYNSIIKIIKNDKINNKSIDKIDINEKIDLIIDLLFDLKIYYNESNENYYIDIIQYLSEFINFSPETLGRLKNKLGVTND